MQMQWEDISTAPHDGTTVLVETSEGYIVSATYWTVEMLLEAVPGSSWRKDEEYWCHNNDDICCEPVKWLKGFPMPEHITHELNN